MAENGEFPSSAAILNDSNVLAVGVLVTPMHVFTACKIVGYVVELDVIFDGNCTAGYCMHMYGLNFGNTHQFLAEGNINRSNDTKLFHFRPYNVENVTLVAGSKWIYELQGGQSRAVGSSYSHPDCEIKSWHLIRHNVGVFEAREPFEITANLQSMILWSDDFYAWETHYQYLQAFGAPCVVVGWGRTKDSNYSERLRVVDVKVVPDKNCIEQFCEVSKDLCIELETNFGLYGKLCVQNVGSAHACGDNDVGAALYCNSYVNGLLSRSFGCSPEGLSVFDKVQNSIDLYTTIQRAASTARALESTFHPAMAMVTFLSAAVGVPEDWQTLNLV